MDNATGMTAKVQRFIRLAREKIRHERVGAPSERQDELNQAELAIRQIVERSRTERITFGKLTSELDAVEKRQNKSRANKSGRTYLNWQNEHLPSKQAGAPGMGKRR